MIISLDIETYGAFERFDNGGRKCPDQTVFNPSLSFSVDGVEMMSRTIPQCAVTVVEGTESKPHAWKPGPTAVFDMTTEDARTLAQILSKAEVILGSNIAFDMAYLLHFQLFSDAIRNRLDGGPTLVDTIILSWIHSGARKERSLKALGPALGAFAYERTLKAGKFPFPMCAEAVKYNAEDSHNAVLAAAVLAQRIWDENHVDLDRAHLSFHSCRLWNIVNMSRAGQMFRTRDLREHESLNLEFCTHHEKALAESGVLLDGEGSATTQGELLDRCVRKAVDIFPDLHDSGLLEYSDKRRAVRNNRENRNVLMSILLDKDPGDRDATLLINLNQASEFSSRHQEVRKILSNTISRGKDAEPVNSGCVGGIFRRSYPSWYGAPTDEGGARSVRLSCRRPAAQTWSRDLRQLMFPGSSRSMYHLDMSAFELRIAALLSGDKQAIWFASNPNPYDMLSASNRTGAKTALLVGINGGTPTKAWRTAIATTGTFMTLASTWALPVFLWDGYRQWQLDTYALGREGKLVLPRAGLLYHHNPTRTMHDTTSFMIQGTAAVFMTKLQYLMNSLGHEVVLQVHDELIMRSHHPLDKVKDDANRMIRMIAYEMFMTCPFTYQIEQCFGPDSYTSAHEKGAADPGGRTGEEAVHLP